MRLPLAQAQSDKAPKGRKSGLADAKRLVRRFAAGERMLSFVPEAGQQGWRMVTRGRLQLVRERVPLQNQIESLPEEGRIQLSSVISDLLRRQWRRILRAMGGGETRPETLAATGRRAPEVRAGVAGGRADWLDGRDPWQAADPASGPHRSDRPSD